MKPRDILACCFAGYGIYLAFTGIVGSVATVAGMLSMARASHESLSVSQLVQYSFGVLPLLVGLLLATFSPTLGRLAVRCAGLSDASSWSIQMRSSELLAVLLAVLGSFLLASQCGEIIRQSVFIFLAKAGDRDMAEMTIRLGANPSFLITYVGGAAAGAVLMFKCTAIATRLMRYEKSANPPPLSTSTSGPPAPPSTAEATEGRGAPVAPPPGAAGR